MPAPIILQDQSGLGAGIAGAGNALAQALGTRVQQQRNERQQQQYGSILDKTLGQLPENPSALQVTQALSSAMQQGVPSDIAQNYGSLYSTLQKSQPNLPPGPDEINSMSNLFRKFGMEEDVALRNAELWGKLTTGGQTEMAKMLVDQISRNQFRPKEQQIDDPAGMLSGEGVEEVLEVQEFKWPKVDIFEDRTPKERANLKGELLKTNNAEYKEISEKLRKTDQEIMRYDQLERLNDSGKLPSGMGKYNINWTTGDIRIPALASPETQQYVKTINDFTVAAKDTFGARVTNFELGAFMKRLPTLANSEEGRRLILDQMKAMKGLDKLYDESIKAVYDKYGMQKIDRSNVERIAEDYRKDEEERLIKQFNESMNAQEVYTARQNAPEGTLPVRKPDGTIGYLPIDKVDLAKKKGWEIL